MKYSVTVMRHTVKAKGVEEVLFLLSLIRFSQSVSLALKKKLYKKEIIAPNQSSWGRDVHPTIPLNLGQIIPI